MTSKRSESSRLLAVVPPEHRWLATLHRAMQQLGLPLRDCVLADGRLRASATTPVGLSLVLEPHRAERPHFRKLGPFALSYDGSSELGPEAERMVRGFAHVVTRLASHIPRRLQGFAAIVEAEPSAERTLCKLFPFVTVERSRGPGGEHVEVLLRTTSGCNQACPFCSAPRHMQPGFEIVIACIRHTAALLPAATLTLTGGEPTLKASFAEELAAALAESNLGSVQVQTNAVSFASRLDPRELPRTPRLSFFVSLHATDASIYDACTATAGQMHDALSGIERLLAAGQRVTLNTVACSLNIRHLEALAASMPAGAASNRVRWHLSALICPRDNPNAPDYLVRYSELLPIVRRATEIAVVRGIETSSLLSSTHATVPPCVLPDPVATPDRRWLVSTGGAVERSRDDNHDDRPPPDRTWADGCAGCAEYDRCPGVPFEYARRFGLAELRPLGSSGTPEPCVGDPSGNALGR